MKLTPYEVSQLDELNTYQCDTCRWGYVADGDPEDHNWLHCPQCEGGAMLLVENEEV